ncbi:hypothetical protein ACLOJK_026099 [Asimina triloba]
MLSGSLRLMMEESDLLLSSVWIDGLSSPDRSTTAAVIAREEGGASLWMKKKEKGVLPTADVADDEGAWLQSHRIGCHSLAAGLLDGSDHPIGASTMVILVGSGVGKIEICRDLNQHVVPVILTGMDRPSGCSPENPGCRLEEDDGAPKLVLRRCTKRYVHAVKFGAL